MVGAPICNSTHWSTEETKLLIKTWGEHRDEFAEIKRNLSVWNKVLERLLSVGFFRTVEQCRNRWKFLETKYKVANKEFHAVGKTSWEFYDDMDFAKNGNHHDATVSTTTTATSTSTSTSPPQQSFSHGPTSSLFTDSNGRVQLPPIRSPPTTFNTPKSTAQPYHGSPIISANHQQQQQQQQQQKVSSIFPPHHYQQQQHQQQHLYNQPAVSDVRGISPPSHPHYDGYQHRVSRNLSQGSLRHTSPHQQPLHHPHHPLASGHTPGSLPSSTTPSPLRNNPQRNSPPSHHQHHMTSSPPNNGMIINTQGNQISALRNGYLQHHRASSADTLHGIYPLSHSPLSSSSRTASSNAQLISHHQQLKEEEGSPSVLRRTSMPTTSAATSATSMPVNRQQQQHVHKRHFEEYNDGDDDGDGKELLNKVRKLTLTGTVKRSELLEFLKDQALRREQREDVRRLEIKRLEQMRFEEERRYHEFQMSLIQVINHGLAPHAVDDDDAGDKKERLNGAHDVLVTTKREEEEVVTDDSQMKSGSLSP
ncbi:hypothetical protein GGI12_002012 [Dipsacomyces acuminosporus]|nr:hypothetical protein GGI12_002012 [Dipsacomyces acuminosporus]